MTARQLALADRRARARAETKRPRLESAARGVLRDLLRSAAARFAEKATPHLTAAGDWTPPADDEVLPLDEIMKRYRTKTDPVRQSAVADFFAAYGASAAHAGVRLNWEVTNPVVAALIERLGAQVEYVSETTRENIRAVIARSYREGLSVPDTAAALRELAPSIAEARATLIARTEFVGLTRGGSLAATGMVAEATGITYLKTWRTAPGAEYPRHEDYADLDGQTVPLAGVFDVGGEALAFPGDPDGDPAEICNCRCDLEYVESGAE